MTVLNCAKTRAAKVRAQRQFSEINVSVIRLCRREKCQWINAIAEEAEKAAATGNMKLLYDCSRRLTGDKKPTKVPIKDKQGKLITDPQEQLKCWYEHFTEVFKMPSTSHCQQQLLTAELKE